MGVGTWKSSIWAKVIEKSVRV
ncbi:uncharacterized protein G2W53_013365 [Senna tora]|uniref:Uncharacterized protein n=1 Tax=Senna tora TaxID=362788 RepID=A0A834TZ38_9FABA|nr:uncharacterized protein G2W53_013365 [Senna tora]